MRSRSPFLAAVLLAGLIPGAAVPVAAQAREPEAHETPRTYQAGATTGRLTGQLEARLTVDGAPAVGWRCVLLDEAAATARRLDRVKAPEMAAGEADADGLCRLAGVPPGVYLLRVSPPGETVGSAERSARVAAGGTGTLALDLSRIPLTGWITRDDEPAPGYRVNVSWKGDRPTADVSTQVAAAGTDEDGEYEAVVWQPGTYALTVTDPTGGTVDRRTVAVGSGETVVSFRLAGRAATGVVVDAEGRPQPGAAVMIAWAEETGARRTTSTTAHGVEEDGAFSIPLEAGPGTVRLNARGTGGRGSNVVEIPLEEGESPGPVTLTLEPSKNVRGVLVDAAGNPVENALVMSFLLPSSTGGDATIGFDETDADGAFEVHVGDEPIVRLYATGAGCPLLRVDLSEPSAEPIRLECPAGSGALRLRVRDPAGEPLPGVKVNLRLGGEPLPRPAIGSHFVLRELSEGSDRSGELTIPDLPPGPCEVYLPNGSHLAVSITAGGVTEEEIVLEPRR